MPARSRPGITTVTDAEVVAANVRDPSSIKRAASTEHQAKWNQIGGSKTAAPAFRDQDGNIHIRNDHWLLAPSSRAGIPPVDLRGGRPAPTKPARVSAQAPVGEDIGLAKTEPPPPVFPAPVNPSRRQTGAASPESQRPMAPPPRKGGRWMPKVPPQPVSEDMVNRLKGRPAYTIDHEHHKKAWALLGGKGEAPPAFISENDIYLDPSRWPPKR